MSKQIIFPEGVPLNQWQNGTIRVIGSRVTLDTIIVRMQVGDTPEEIHEGFPTVTLEQINTIIDWYFKNQVEADEYLMEQEAEGERIRQEIESQPEYKARREELRRRIAQLTKT
ncbi:MAG TPA: DUF433 domain-containing protein [Pyrinomonadaceae bacterium]|nr:DUF433 domain-containing protein [Pyrinomonadaceae bacterium]